MHIKHIQSSARLIKLFVHCDRSHLIAHNGHAQSPRWYESCLKAIISSGNRRMKFDAAVAKRFSGL